MQALQTLIDKADKMCGGTTKLAEVLGTAPQNVSLMKAGKRPISPATAAELADLVGEDVDAAIKLAVFESVKGTRRESKMRDILGKAVAAGAAAMLVSGCNVAPNGYTNNLSKTSVDVKNIYIVSIRRWLKRWKSFLALQQKKPSSDTRGLSLGANY